MHSSRAGGRQGRATIRAQGVCSQCATDWPLASAWYLQVLELEDFGECIFHGTAGLGACQVEKLMETGVVSVSVLALTAVLLKGGEAGDEVGQVLRAFALYIAGDFRDGGEFCLAESPGRRVSV